MATTIRKDARARLLQNQAEATAQRRERERRNITTLTEFAVQAAGLEEVDNWLAARIERAQQEAEDRRTRHRVAAGRELATMRKRGESVADIAEQAGISQAKVREYLKAAEDADTDQTASPAKAVGRPKASAPEPEPEPESPPVVTVVDQPEPAAPRAVALAAAEAG
jgi:hypothetical protein